MTAKVAKAENKRQQMFYDRFQELINADACVQDGMSPSTSIMHEICNSICAKRVVFILWPSHGPSVTDRIPRAFHPQGFTLLTGPSLCMTMYVACVCAQTYGKSKMHGL